MKKRQLIIVYLLNLLGLISAIGALYFVMFGASLNYALIAGGAALLFIVLSYIVHKPKPIHRNSDDDEYLELVKNPRFNQDIVSIADESSDEKNTFEEDEEDVITPSSEITSDFSKDNDKEISDEVITETPVIVAETPLQRNAQFKLNAPSYKDNLEKALRLLDEGYLYLKNDEYTYRLEALLKLDKVDQKIWETNYEVFPLIGFTKKDNDLIVNVGLSKDDMIPVGMLPSSANDLLKDKGKIALNAQLMSGNFRFISSENHSFETYSETPSVILTIIRKG